MAAAAAVEARPELVGKRFLCVSGEAPPELAEMARWPWRVGVIRAVSHRDPENPELTVGTPPRCAHCPPDRSTAHRRLTPRSLRLLLSNITVFTHIPPANLLLLSREV